MPVNIQTNNGTGFVSLIYFQLVIPVSLPKKKGLITSILAIIATALRTIYKTRGLPYRGAIISLAKEESTLCILVRVQRVLEDGEPMEIGAAKSILETEVESKLTSSLGLDLLGNLEFQAADEQTIAYIFLEWIVFLNKKTYSCVSSSDEDKFINKNDDE